MFTLNIKNEYDITGTNKADAFWLSSDTPEVGAPLKNGYSGIEMDTGRVYFYDEEGQKWWPFGT